MLERVRTHPSLTAKREFLRKLGDELPMQLLSWACMEGIAFAGAFAVVFFFKDKSKMPGLAAANQYIARDEALHRDFAVHLLKDLSIPLPLRVIKATIHAFVEQEKLYYADFKDVLDIGAYSEFVGHQLLNALSDEQTPAGVCPLPFMASMSLKHESNFFEVIPTDYEEAQGEVRWGDIEDL
jgi:ribonucleotide reductase beta subunit family protein with ferritin-like domain